MKDYSIRGKLSVGDMSGLHMLGLITITKHDKYNKDEYDSNKIWAVGLGSLIGNHDIRDYDPKKYTYTELRILALQDKFKDIGGSGVDVNDYLAILKKYYPGNLDDVLHLTIASKYIYDELTLISISDAHHPPLVSLYKQAGIDMSEGWIVKQVIHTRRLLTDMVDAFIWENALSRS